MKCNSLSVLGIYLYHNIYCFQTRIIVINVLGTFYLKLTMFVVIRVHLQNINIHTALISIKILA